eukprot:UN21929
MVHRCTLVHATEVFLSSEILYLYFHLKKVQDDFYFSKDFRSESWRIILTVDYEQMFKDKNMFKYYF